MFFNAFSSIDFSELLIVCFVIGCCDICVFLCCFVVLCHLFCVLSLLFWCSWANFRPKAVTHERDFSSGPSANFIYRGVVFEQNMKKKRTILWLPKHFRDKIEV